MNSQHHLIKNIYYMLAYAFSALEQTQFQKISSENFERVHDLLAAILCAATSQQLKRGIYKTYEPQREDSNTPRGHINITASLRNLARSNQKLNCSHDEFLANNQLNQIIKTSLLVLLKHPDVTKERKLEIRRLLRCLNDVDELNIQQINWSRLHFCRQNQSYQAIIFICKYVIQSKLLSSQAGNEAVQQYGEHQLHHLYEKFVLNYYRKEHPEYKAKPMEIKWDLTSGSKDELGALPAMRTDITLSFGAKTLIIDTKFYGHSMQRFYDKESFLSANLYQVFSYVKNYDKEHSGQVGGLLLYAKNKVRVAPDADYEVGHNHFAVRTLDLNCDFAQIRAKLDKIATDYLLN